MNRQRSRHTLAIGLGLLVAAIVSILASAVVRVPMETAGLSAEVDRRLGQAGARNPVTAVLLNFRAYDTLLEVAVLLLAALGARALAASPPSDTNQRPRLPTNPVLLGFVRLIAPVMILVAGYLLWVGGHASGGAFQAGAVLAALGVLLRLSGVNWAHRVSERGERVLLVVGLAVFLAIGVCTMSDERQLLAFSPRWAKWLILLIEAAAMVSIATIMVALFHAGSLRDGGQSRESGKGIDK